MKSGNNIFDKDSYTMYSSEGTGYETDFRNDKTDYRLKSLNSQDMDYGYPGIDFSLNGESKLIADLKEVKMLLEEKVIAKSFLFMFFALIITAIAALATTPEMAAAMLNGHRYWILLILEFGIVFASNYALTQNNVFLVGVLYAVYSYINGMTLSVIFMIFTTSSVVSIFLITAGIFLVMAVYGLLAKKDLSTVGSLCLMGLFGIILSGVVNIFFLQNTMADMVICSIGVLLFVGLTAYDVQKIKESVALATEENSTTLALYGGFQLYLDFINLLWKLLKLFGKSRD